MGENALSRSLRLSLVRRSDEVQAELRLRRRILRYVPAVGPPEFILRIDKVPDGDIGLHPETGDHRIEARIAALAVICVYIPFQIQNTTPESLAQETSLLICPLSGCYNGYIPQRIKKRGTDMEKIKKNFGFGFMRLPMKDGEIDTEETKRMVDAFLDAGFNYFDTAHGYHKEKSEIALRECLTSRYPRESYVLADKLTENYFKTEADIRPVLEEQLAACGVEYFDFYLMHSQCALNYPHFKACRAYETAFALKAEGKVRHVGISFHDRAEVLEQILTEYPEIEVVQIQFNYLDYDDPAVQSRKCYEVCVKHGKPVIVMEPVKGGNLVNLPEEAKAVLDELHGGSPASYALRFAAGFPGMMMVLSGMSSMEQMRDNLSFMADFRPLNDTELAAIARVQAIFRGKHLIPCTSCRYCTDGCPKHIAIPDLFATMNTRQLYHDWNAGYYYDIHTMDGRKASDCVKCGKCEHVCPQHLPIRKLLEDVAKEFETKE